MLETFKVQYIEIKLDNGESISRFYDKNSRKKDLYMEVSVADSEIKLRYSHSKGEMTHVFNRSKVTSLTFIEKLDADWED